MSNLQTLEDIAFQLEGILSSSKPAPSVPIEIEDASAEQLKFKLDRLITDTEQRATYFKERLQELEDLLDKPIDLTSDIVFQNATGIISNIHTAKRSIELARVSANELHDAYRQRQLTEAGFDSYEAVKKEIFSLQIQSYTLRNKFLGSLRYKGVIRDLNSKINSLYDLSNTQDDGIRLPEIDYLENIRIEDAQGKLFVRFANELFAQYRTQLEQLSDRKTTLLKLNADVLESLTDDYISKYFKPKINQELAANKNRDDQYGRKAAAVLKNPRYVSEALAVLKDGLNQSRYSNWNDSDEDREGAKSLNDRVEALPTELRIIVERGMTRKDKTTNEEFAEFGNYLTQVPIDIEKRRILTSFSKVRQHISNISYDDDLPYSITGKRWELERTANEIETSLRSEKSDYLKELDIEKWDVFRNNAGVQQLYGREALESFNQLIRDEVFDRLLVTPKHTDESVSLGYKALGFKDPDAVVYNLLNFWREPGYSGEKPFLSVHSSSENTSATQYVTSLTEEQLRAVEQLRIPGLMDIINTIKQHPNTFMQSQFREGEEWVDNPVYERVQEALGKVCGHYLEKGSEQEKYFAVGAVVDLGFMRFADKPSQQRDQLIEVLSERIGLDEHMKSNFKKHYGHFLDRLGGSARRMTDLRQYKGDLVAISNYYDDLDNLLTECVNPDKIREEANSMQNDYNYVHEVGRDLPKLIAYLQGFDSEIVQNQLVDPEYAEKLKKRLWIVKQQIFRSNARIEDVTEYVTSDFTVFRDFIDATNELAQKSSVRDVLKSEQARMLDSLVYSDDLAAETTYIPEYFRALDDVKTAKKFFGKDVQAKINLDFLAKTAYNCDKALVVPLTREAIQRDVTYGQLSQIYGYLPKIAEFSGFVSACAGERDNQICLFDLLYELSTMEEDSLKLVSKIESGDLDFNLAQDLIKRLSQGGIKSTSYLVENLVSAENRDKTIQEWSNVMDFIIDGNFDANNELHRNLEYTRFRAIVDHEKVRRHMKNHFTFTDYLSIFDRTEGTPELTITEQDRFEIDCVAEEAKVLRDYVLSVKQRADKLGREVYLVPNLSYGYLPVSPIVEELERQGVKAIIGVKIGSTESHNNKEVVSSRLFKGYRTKLADEQPIMVVVDGTKHLVARDDQDKAARYPDAYQGYLNQVVAMNDAMGFTEVDYSNAGKTDADMERLRQTPEFQRLVDVYKNVINPDAERERKPYQFGLWNSAGIDLIIRNYHHKIGNVTPTNPEEIEGPAMIFCNVGLLDEQIRQELKDKYSGLTHIPAYFDDSGKIISFDFGFDNFGVKYLNTLETEIKKAFGSMHSKLPNGDFVSSLIRYVQNTPAQPVGYEA